MMDRLILLFLQRDIENQPGSLLPYLYLSSIIIYTYTRNKRIAHNQATEPQFILSGNAERTKRNNQLFSNVEIHTHSSVRYINAHQSKGNCKNSYQGVVCPISGGNRP